MAEEKEKITLRCGEYITHLTCANGEWNNQRVVAKLTVHTNLRPNGYGTYGNGVDTTIFSNSTTKNTSGGRVTGFLGTHNKYLMSIGAYGTEELKVVKDGPYGSKLAENWYMEVKENEVIMEIIIRHKFVVQAFGLVIAKPGGIVTTMFGGKRGDESKITLKNGEYITHISGIDGDHRGLIDQRVIAMLKIHTNLNPTGYGPFGNAYNVDNVGIFLSPPMPSNRHVNGFFGRYGAYLESIGTIGR